MSAAGVEVTISAYLHVTLVMVSAVTVYGINLATGDAVEVGEAVVV